MVEPAIGESGSLKIKGCAARKTAHSRTQQVMKRYRRYCYCFRRSSIIVGKPRTALAQLALCQCRCGGYLWPPTARSLPFNKSFNCAIDGIAPLQHHHVFRDAHVKLFGIGNSLGDLLKHGLGEE